MNIKIIILASSFFLASCGEEEVTHVGPASGEPSTPIVKSYTSDPIWNVVAVPLSTADGSAASPYSYNTTIKDLKDPSITYWIHVDSGPNILDRVDDGRGTPTGTTHEDSTRVFFTFGAKYLPDESLVTGNGVFKYNEVIQYFVQAFDKRFIGAPQYADSNVTLQRWGRMYSPARFYSGSMENSSILLKRMCPELVELHGNMFKVKSTSFFQRPKLLTRDTSYPTGVIPQYHYYCPSPKQIKQIDSGYLDIPGMRLDSQSDLFDMASTYWKCKDSLMFLSGKTPMILDDSARWGANRVPTSIVGEYFANSFDGYRGSFILCTVDSKYAD